jgi:hypothetical protein
MDRLTPTASHLTIARTDWAAMFTTNFDRLVEDAYRAENLRDSFLTESLPVNQHVNCGTELLGSSLDDPSF